MRCAPGNWSRMRAAFYKRRRFASSPLHRGAVDRSRGNLKPEILAAGAYGIPLRDEIELEKHP